MQNPRTGGRREDPIALDRKDVVTRALGNRAFGVQHDGFKHAGLDRFDFGKNIVEVVQTLDSRIETVDRNSRPLRHNHRHAIPIQLFGIQLNFVGDNEGAGRGTSKRMKPERADPASEYQTNVAVGDSIRFHRFSNGILDLFEIVGRYQMDQRRRFEHPCEVRLQFEDAATVGPNSLKTAVAIEQTMIEDRDLGLGAGNEFSVEPDV